MPAFKIILLILYLISTGCGSDYESIEHSQLYNSRSSEEQAIYDPAQLQREIEDDEIHNRSIENSHTLYYDSLEDSTDIIMPDVEDDPTIKIFRTTMIPDYIRKQKLYNEYSTEEISNEEHEGDSGYIEMGPIETKQRNESTPLAMKSNVLYTDESDLHDIRHQQLDNSNSSMEEEYYEDAPESIEELYPSSLLGTTAVNAPIIITTSSPVKISATAGVPLAIPAPIPSAQPGVIKNDKQIKQSKQIHIIRRKLLPHEQLRNYVEDAYIRMPLAVIVDPSSESLERTKALWREALRSNIAIKIVLIALNASGAPTAYSFNNTRQFLAGLNSIKENSGGNAFIGIVHASELVPYDSAVFISTAVIPAHTELVQDAAITLLKKRIRLYLVWYGERLDTENETQEAVGGILGEVAVRSGGDILHVVGNDTSQELEGNALTLVANTFHGSQEIEVPIDTTLSSLHVKIDSMMRSASLETPNGG